MSFRRTAGGLLVLGAICVLVAVWLFAIAEPDFDSPSLDVECGTPLSPTATVGPGPERAGPFFPTDEAAAIAYFRPRCEDALANQRFGSWTLAGLGLVALCGGAVLVRREVVPAVPSRL